MASMPATLHDGDLHCFALNELFVLLSLANAFNGAKNSNKCAAREDSRTFKRLRLASFTKQARLPTLHP